MSQYAALAKHIDMDKIEIAMLPGAPNKRGYISYWILDPEKTQEVINRVIYRDKAPVEDMTNLSASILSSNSSKLPQVEQALNAAGINIKCRGTASRAHSQFIAHSSKITNEYYNHLAKENPSLANLQFVYDPVNYQCGQTDFTIILSGDQ